MVTEFQLRKKVGYFYGIAEWAEQPGANQRSELRFRIMDEGDLIFGTELKRKDCQRIDLKLEAGSVLRIETGDGGNSNISDHMAFDNLRIEY